MATRSKPRATGDSLSAVLRISEWRLAGYCSILLGATLVVVTIAYAIIPGNQGDVDQILNVAGTSPKYFEFLYAAFALSGVFGLAVVGPVSSLVADPAPGWLVWGRRLAYVGFALTVVEGLRLAADIPQVGQLYHGCGHCSLKLADQQTLARWLYVNLSLDPNDWIIFGAVGLWAGAVSAVGLSSKTLPPILGWVGVALAVAYWLIVLASIIGSSDVFLFAALVAGIFLGPFWYIWLGVLLTARR